MQLISYKNLIGLPVYTQSEQYLGKVSDFKLDTLTHSIIEYRISASSLIKKLFKPQLIISYKQVISLDEEKMIVEDNFCKESEPLIAPVSSSG